jgi:GNAT superfamily N-acetyltransferase
MERESGARGPERSGGEVCVRPGRPEDRGGLRDMFYRLSPKSTYLRFLAPYPRVPERALDLLLGAGSLVAVAGKEVVGRAMYVRTGREAEVAVVVEDGWQGRGVGKLLMNALAGRAAHEGVEVLTGDVLGENRRMMGLLKALFGEVESRAGGGAYHVRIRLRESRAQEKAA